MFEFATFSLVALLSTNLATSAFTILKSSFDFSKSGRRGSNSRHSAWKADALPTELLPHLQFLNLCLICECKYSYLIIFCASIFCFFSDKTVCFVITTKIFRHLLSHKKLNIQLKPIFEFIFSNKPVLRKDHSKQKH